MALKAASSEAASSEAAKAADADFTWREQLAESKVDAGEKEIGGSGSGVHLSPPGPLPMHLHTACVELSECLPTLLNPPAERTCFSQVDAARLQEELAAAEKARDALDDELTDHRPA